MKLPNDPRLPTSEDLAALRTRLYELHRDIALQVNALSDNAWRAVGLSGTAAPTTGTYAQGDIVRNSNPIEAGAATVMYVNLGWICVAGGTPGTWKEMRVHTGN